MDTATTIDPTLETHWGKATAAVALVLALAVGGLAAATPAAPVATAQVGQTAGE